MATNGALIHWYCASAAHRERPDSPADRLTIHSGQWAFCPMDSRASEHDWRPTGGIALEKAAPLLQVVSAARAS